VTAPAVVDGIARTLAAAQSGWTYDPDAVLDPDLVPITLGDLPPDGIDAVTITTYPGGPEPDSRNGWEYPRLQVRVRGANTLTALALDRAAYDVLQALSGVTLPGGTWWLQDCHAIQSEAQPMGVDANGRHEFSRNYQLTVLAG